jgi:hypothetical protein
MIGSAAVAAPPAEGRLKLPNAADPQPATPDAQGAAQAVVVTLEKRAETVRKAPPQNQKSVAPRVKRSGIAAPFEGPKPN